MKRMTPYRVIFLPVCLALVFSCGADPKTGSITSEHAVGTNNDADGAAALQKSCEEAPLEAAGEIRLKDVALLSASLVTTLGPGSTKDVSSGQNLLELYATNFGGADDDRKVAAVSDDQIGGNSVRSDYFMALNFVAYNAGLYCEARKNEEDRCRCDTEEAAKIMLARAVPYQNWCASEHASLIQEVVTLCQNSQKDTITALFSSVAFAKRN